MNNKLFAVLSACLVVAACQIEEFDTDIIGGNLYAHIETFADTKTFMNDQNQILWSEGDQVAAFLKSSHIQKYQINPESIGKTSARFDFISAGSNDVDANWDRNVVYYPYSTQLKCMKSSDIYELSVSLPATQYYSANSFGNRAMPMVGVSKDNDITFRNICGGVKLLLKGTQKVTSIAISGKNNEILCGFATVSAFSDNADPKIKMLSDTSKVVTLECDKGVLLNDSLSTEFITILPPTLFSKGFVVTITDSYGFEYILETDKPNNVKRSSLLVMPEVSLVAPEIKPIEVEYIDEYGINHGSGVEINGMVWAPVNCGYHIEDYPYGKLYQWGRKYGQGYTGENEEPSISTGDISLVGGQIEKNANTFYLMNEIGDWLYYTDNKLWNSGTETTPIKTQYDPCPDGWRVPTFTELEALMHNHSDWTSNDLGQNGYFFTDTNLEPSSSCNVFLSAAGMRGHNDGWAVTRGDNGYYWSSSISNWLSNYILGLKLYNSKVGRFHMLKACGSSVRCICDVQTLGVKYPQIDEHEGIPVVSVNVNPSPVKLYVGDMTELTTYIKPTDATQKDVIWTSENSSIAVVDQNGVVTALSVGDVVITASVGEVSSKSFISVLPRAEATLNYIDEYGINHGKGIAIGSTVWAPVNCGYHIEDYPYGKLYQWGRKYGQGYSERYDVNTPEFEKGGVDLLIGQSDSNENVFFTGSYDWLSPSDDSLWNGGSESTPIKTLYDPCPDGWRVPTSSELKGLLDNQSSLTTNEQGCQGCWCSGSSIYSNKVPSIFLSFAGYREFQNGSALSRGSIGNYWSSKANAAYTNDVQKLCINKNYASIEYSSRADGHSVRCVQDNVDFVDVSSIGLDVATLEVAVGESSKLNAIISPANATQKKVYWHSENESIAVVDQNGYVMALSVGESTITATIGSISAVCNIVVYENNNQSVCYIDEYGINHGRGICIGDNVWSPVNCGYHK